MPSSRVARRQMYPSIRVEINSRRSGWRSVPENAEDHGRIRYFLLPAIDYWQAAVDYPADRVVAVAPRPPRYTLPRCPAASSAFLCCASWTSLKYGKIKMWLDAGRSKSLNLNFILLSLIIPYILVIPNIRHGSSYLAGQNSRRYFLAP